MSAKYSKLFECTNCGSQFPKWSGRCTTCGKWNTLIEQAPVRAGSGVAVRPARVQTLEQVHAASMARLKSGLAEVDLILGGPEEGQGLVPGSLVLLGGDPGIGKSTLALQMALHLAARGVGTLYVSGEESLPQIKLRAERISRDLSKLGVLSENNLEQILATIEAGKPTFVVIDSIQTMYSDQTTGVAGGVAQVSYATARIMEFIKQRGIAALIIGHVTKEGNLAGPRLLEHMVDVVLYLEGERFLSFRVLRCIKNRFGATTEVGVFEMREEGLAAVANPSDLFLSERVVKKPGNVVTCTVEGSRALLLEIQALTSKTQFNYPKRTATGFDYNRLQLIAAVLSQRLRLPLSDCDIFASVVGGFRITETACDLAVALAIVSSLKDLPVPDDLAMVGEVGLSGEVRKVGQAERRVGEAAKLGFRRMLVPVGNKLASSKIKLLPVADLSQAMDLVFKNEKIKS